VQSCATVCRCQAPKFPLKSRRESAPRRPAPRIRPSPANSASTATPSASTGRWAGRNARRSPARCWRGTWRRTSPTRWPTSPKFAPPSFLAFARSTVAFSLHAWQERYLCPLIERLAHERGVRALIHAPPQYGKSIWVGQRAPAWLLGVDPLHRIGLACYNETHAEGFGQVVKSLMLAPEFAEAFPDPRVPGPQRRGGRRVLHGGPAGAFGRAAVLQGDGPPERLHRPRRGHAHH
jgi:hypothetical protein